MSTVLTRAAPVLIVLAPLRLLDANIAAGADGVFSSTDLDADADVAPPSANDSFDRCDRGLCAASETAARSSAAYLSGEKRR